MVTEALNSVVVTGAMIEVGVSPTQAKLFAPTLAEILPAFGITTRPRVAAFLAQCHHESLGFTRLEENLSYRTPERIRAMWPTRVTNLADAAALCRRPQALADWVYSGRGGNGPKGSGDGWKYRGRGIIMLTFKGNYAKAGAALGRDYVAQPELVAQPLDAVKVACWYWDSGDLNRLADASNIDAITKAVNGPAMAGAAERRQLFREYVDAFRGFE